ncbi:MAG: signal peptidase I [Chlamydiia bacterium]|nr:signal peptidase I [Chlamydiia bacterium]
MFFKKFIAFRVLGKLRRQLGQLHRLYKAKAHRLDIHAKQQIQTQLSQFRITLLEKDAEGALQASHQLQASALRFMPKTLWDKARDFVGAIGFALLVAVVIRTMWFEPYTIPTGSMRPTLKEGDFLVVSKTDYGINVPLQPAHFYFDPKLVQRGGIFVFSGDKMDIPDSDTTYFYLFPGKKLYVKRLLGKPGDTLYFYGGNIYGIDAAGNELKELRESSWSQSLEHIPFIRFDGKVDASLSKQGIFTEALFSQMHKPIAKLSLTPIGTIAGEMLPGTADRYSDLWGFKNYAMSRLLTPEQAKQLHPNAFPEIGEGPLYLELTHHPSLQGAQLARDENNRLRPDLAVSTSLLPLNQSHIEEIARHLVTCRFIVENGVSYRYGFNLKNPSALSYLPRLPDVPDGTYEIQNGKAYQILLGGITKQLPLEHPLYRTDPERLQLLYNLGIEFINYYSPSKNNRLHPSRYAYFRDQDLYLFGAPIIKKEDPALTSFLQREREKQSMSTSVRPYFPFKDEGAPLNSDGSLNVDFIRKYGLTVPSKMYLALGDNHAMSADSRQFGFVPEDNIRGGPSFSFWPPGARFGQLPQPSYPHLTFPNLFVWCGAILIGISSSIYVRRKLRKPFDFERDLYHSKGNCQT